MSRAPHAGAFAKTTLVLLLVAGTGLGASRPAAALETLSPREYHRARVRALEAAQRREAATALPLFESLAATFPEDGGTWLSLGNGYLAAKQYPKAIDAYRRALDLGWGRGFSVRYNIACAYALDGKPDSAFAWLGRSLVTGLENRSMIDSDEDFASLRSDPRYPALLGRQNPGPKDRVEGWRRDLRFLESEIERLHMNVGQSAPRETLAAAFDALEARIPNIPDHLMPFELQRIVRRLGDGHSVVYPTSERAPSTQLPVRFYWFSDGLYVVSAPEGMESIVGSRVVALGRGRAESFAKDLEAVVTRDNSMGILWLGPYYLSFPMVLQGLGYIDALDRVPMTVADRAGKRREVLLTPTLGHHPMPFTAPKGAGDPPLWLQHSDRAYWMETLPADSALYVQVNQIRDAEGETLREFSRRVRERAAQADVIRLVVDLRLNNGGNSFLNDELVRALVHFRQLREDGRTFVLIGRNTFSAAMNLTTDIERWVDPIFVGEPTGSRPNMVGEDTNVLLPWSGVRASVSSRYHQESYPGDDRIWIPPDVPVTLSAADYFSNRDPGLDAVRSLWR